MSGTKRRRGYSSLRRKRPPGGKYGINKRLRSLATSPTVLGRKSGFREPWTWGRRSRNGSGGLCYGTQMWLMTAVAPVWRWPQMKRDGLLCNFYSETRCSRATQKRIDLLLSQLAALCRGCNAIFKLHGLFHQNIWNISLTLLLRAARLFHRNSLRLSVKNSSRATQKKKKKKHKAVWIMWASARLCFWCVQNLGKIFPVALYVAALLYSPVCALSGVMSWGMRNRCAWDVWTSRPSVLPTLPNPTDLSEPVFYDRGDEERRPSWENAERERRIPENER